MKIDNITNTYIPNTNLKEDQINKLNENSEKLKDEQALKKSCQDFEAIFVHMLLKSARSTESDDGIIPKSSGTKIFEDMFDQEMAEKISTSHDGGIGIAKVLYEQMKVGIRK